MKSIIPGVACIVLLTALLASCGSKTTTENSPTPSEEATQAADRGPAGQMQENDGTVRGVVTAVDGVTVTVQTIGMDPGGEKPNGQPPQQGDAKTDSSAQPDIIFSASPEVNNKQIIDSGGQVPGQGSGADGQPGGEQDKCLTIELTDDVPILLDADGQTSEGTAEDITVGVMIGIIYGDDGESVSSIIVYQKFEGTPQPQQSN